MARAALAGVLLAPAAGGQAPAPGAATAVEGAPAPAAATDTRSAAERIDLTRITMLHADYVRAAREHDAADLAVYEREIAAMLRDDVLPDARGAGPSLGARGEGTGSGAAAPRRDGTAGPAVAVDEEEIGAAARDAEAVDLAREFVSLEGKRDEPSLARKSSILGSLQGISERAQFPGSAPDPEQAREARQRAGQERREREEAEKVR